jgi:uncharacterized Zn finger protein (UPF0148 family)
VTISKLPEINLTCRNGHTFPTRARGGATVRCKTCGTPKHVPVARPRTEREARDRASRAAQAEAGTDLGSRWKDISPWDGLLAMLPGRESDKCGQCGGPLQWEPGRTMVYCPECRKLQLPAAIAEHYARQAQRSAEVAVRTAPDTSAQRRARVQVRRVAQQLTEGIEEWLDVLDPNGLPETIARQARSYRAELSAYLPEIRSAITLADLNEISAELGTIITRINDEGVVDSIGRYREAAERQAEAAEREAREQAAIEAKKAREAREAKERAAIEARERAAIAAWQRKGPVEPEPKYLESVEILVNAIKESQRNKKRKLAAHGPCKYEHRKPAIPARRYWMAIQDRQGNVTGNELPGAPAVVVCGKHFAAAEAWIQEQSALLKQHGIRVIGVYTELN